MEDEPWPTDDEAPETDQVADDSEVGGPHDGPADGPADGSADVTERTGHPGVDEVLDRLDGLDDRSVHDHVAVFEEAHASLRRALDTPASDPSDA